MEVQHHSSQLAQQIEQFIFQTLQENKGLALYREPQTKNLSYVKGDVSEFSSTCLEDQSGFAFASFDGENDLLINAEAHGALNLSDSKEDITGSFPRNGISQNTAQEDFVAQVEQAVEEIKKNSFDKVVLSKLKHIEVNQKVVVPLFLQLLESYPNCFVSLVISEKSGTWIGATPEVLLSKDKDQFKTMSLAGTQSAVGTPVKEAVWRQKEIEEQAYVSRYIINCFKHIRLREFEEHGPKTVQAGNLLHLKTDFVVDLHDVDAPNIDQTMLDLLHPTSAVCGMPLTAAKAFIEKHEKHQRGFYSGFLGPINIDHKTALFVNLRCCELTRNGLNFYAGAGITEDSDPEKEWLETELKCDTLMSKL